MLIYRLKKILFSFTGTVASFSVAKKKLLDPFVLKRQLPKNIIPSDQKYFENEIVKSFGPINQINVKNAVLVVQEGLVIKSWHILSSSLISEEMRYWHGISYYKNAYARPENLTHGKYLMVYNHFGVGYGHWLADILPRLFIIKEELTKYKILLPENYNTFHLRTLAPFGITSENLVFLKSEKSYKIPDLTIVDHVGGSCNTKDEILQALRTYYLNYYLGPELPVPFRKIYISRSRQKNRKVVNELEVESLMLKHGFEIMFPEDFTFEKQVKYFAECKVMIGLTGSGLTNMLFMQESTAVVEFKMKDDYDNLHYFSMSSGLLLDYYYVLCEVKGKDRFAGDFLVPLNTLQEVINTFQ